MNACLASNKILNFNFFVKQLIIVSLSLIKTISLEKSVYENISENTFVFFVDKKFKKMTETVAKKNMTKLY